MLKQSAYLLVLFVFFYTNQIYAIVSQEEIRAIGAKCNATTADLEIALKYQIPETESGKCLMLCMLKEYKTLDDAGSYKENTAFTSLKVKWAELPEDKLKEIAHECKQVLDVHASEANTCEYGYLAIKCINVNYHKHNLFSLLAPNKTSTSKIST